MYLGDLVICEFEVVEEVLDLLRELKVQVEVDNELVENLDLVEFG